MAFSAWKIWLHPKFTARTMDALETDAMSAADECQRLNNTILQLSTDNEKLNITNTALSADLKKIQNELSEVREELLSFSETEAHLREFEKALAGVEQLKADYERRIASLRQTIKLLKSDHKSRPVPGDLCDEIDMLSTSDPLSTPLNIQSHESVPEDEDWLKSLP